MISDTHGLLRPEVVDLFKDCELIIHAGDVGRPDVLEDLRTLAPVLAVRGNVDKAEWARQLPQIQVRKVEDVWVYIIHNLEQLDLNPAVAGFGVIISGHSHHPGIEKRDGVLYLNPGSAGPQRFNLPVTAAWLYVEAGTAEAELIQLSI